MKFEHGPLSLEYGNEGALWYTVLLTPKDLERLRAGKTISTTFSDIGIPIRAKLVKKAK